MSIFQTNEQRAIAYAVCKNLERMLKEDGEIPPGFIYDCSGQRLEITLPPDTVVYRDAGPTGDGTIPKKAVQNLYGYPLWAVLIYRLKRFNQWGVLRTVVLEAMQQVINRPMKADQFRKEMEKEFPGIKEEIETLQLEMGIPDRNEPTPRICKETEYQPTLTFSRKPRK